MILAGMSLAKYRRDDVVNAKIGTHEKYQRSNTSKKSCKTQQMKGKMNYAELNENWERQKKMEKGKRKEQNNSSKTV